MKQQYKFSEAGAQKFSKHGIDLTIYNEKFAPANVVRVHVEEGHFQEFYDKQSAFIYSILSGCGTFYLNGEPVEAEAGDLIVIPAQTNIYYFGTMDMVLSCVPAYNPDNEVHVRFVDKSENPYLHKVAT